MLLLPKKFIFSSFVTIIHNIQLLLSLSSPPSASFQSSLLEIKIITDSISRQNNSAVDQRANKRQRTAAKATRMANGQLSRQRYPIYTKRARVRLLLWLFSSPTADLRSDDDVTGLREILYYSGRWDNLTGNGDVIVMSIQKYHLLYANKNGFQHLS